MPENFNQIITEKQNSKFSDQSDPNLEPKKEKQNPGDVFKELSKQTIVAIAVISLIFGAGGGVLGVVYLTRLPQVKEYLSRQALTGNTSQNITINEDSAVIDVVKKASPAVVSVIISKSVSQNNNNNYGFGFGNPFAPFFSNPPQSQNGGQSSVQEVAAGSGFFVTSDGLILTNKHVADDDTAKYTVVTSDEKTYEAKVLAKDPKNDLAILKIEIKDAPFLTLADSSKIQIGQRVIAIGNSLGQYQNTVTTGIISGIGRSITAGSNDSNEQLEGVIQTDAAINPGNSGGPLLNVAGQVVGINTAIDQQGQLVGFALPSNDASRDLASYQKNGKISQPYLGIRYIIITESIAQDQKLPKDYGALIERGNNSTDLAVVPGSPADKAGLVENDIILEVDGTKVDEKHTLAGLLKNKNVGDTVTLRVYDKGNEKDIKVTLGEFK